MRNGYLRVGVTQFRDDLRNFHDGIGRPVSIMAAVQGAIWTKRCNPGCHDTPASEHKLRLATLVRRAIANYPEIRLQLTGILRKNGGKMRGAGFFFSFKQELEIDRGPHVSGLQDIESGQQSDNRSFVVA